MEGRAFDYLARRVATSGTRRQVMAALLAGTLSQLGVRTATADDDSGTAIADASGGDQNQATVVDPATGGHDRDRDHDGDNANANANAGDYDEDPDDAICQDQFTTRRTECCGCKGLHAGHSTCVDDDLCDDHFKNACRRQGGEFFECVSQPDLTYFCQCNDDGVCDEVPCPGV